MGYKLLYLLSLCKAKALFLIIKIFVHMYIFT